MAMCFCLGVNKECLNVTPERNTYTICRARPQSCKKNNMFWCFVSGFSIRACGFETQLMMHF
jgi:hypothetical protein